MNSTCTSSAYITGWQPKLLHFTFLCDDWRSNHYHRKTSLRCSTKKFYGKICDNQQYMLLEKKSQYCCTPALVSCWVGRGCLADGKSRLSFSINTPTLCHVWLVITGRVSTTHGHQHNDQCHLSILLWILFTQHSLYTSTHTMYHTHTHKDKTIVEHHNTIITSSQITSNNHDTTAI